MAVYIGVQVGPKRTLRARDLRLTKCFHETYRDLLVLEMRFILRYLNSTKLDTYSEVPEKTV